MTLSKELLRIIEIIASKIKLFKNFEHIYLFGSSVKGVQFPQDIDLLIIYSTYCKEIVDDSYIIKQSLEAEMDVPIDLTILSESELIDTRFLDMIGFYYMVK